MMLASMASDLQFPMKPSRNIDFTEPERSRHAQAVHTEGA